MELLKKLENDPVVQALLHQVNKVMIGRMDYNDHGPVHSKIVSEYALKLFEMIGKSTVVEEENGSIEDAKNVIVLGAYLHDVGNAINRKDHEVHGLILANPIIARYLSELYPPERAVKLKTYVDEIILTHECNYIPTSYEAKIVAVADALDMANGRARIAFRQGDKDIHEFSALAIEKVELKKTDKVEIHVYMTNPAGVFQVDELLMKRIKSTGLDLRVVIHLGGEVFEKKRVY